MLCVIRHGIGDEYKSCGDVAIKARDKSHTLSIWKRYAIQKHESWNATVTRKLTRKDKLILSIVEVAR